MKTDRVHILLIILLTVVTWHKITKQTFLGESYYYFDTRQHYLQYNIPEKLFSRYDNGARIFFDIATPLIKDDLALYMLIQLVFITILHVILFKVIKSITTKNTALLTVILFGISYIGSFEMNGTANYQRFVQRTPNILLLLPSFYFLEKYFRKFRIRDGIISITLYVLSLYLAHHSVFFFPIFVVYPIVHLVVMKPRKVIVSLLFPMIFIVITKALIQIDALNPKVNIFTFIKTDTGSLVQKIFAQFTTSTFFEPLVNIISNLIPSSRIEQILIILAPVIFIFIFYGLIKIKDKNTKTLAIASLIATPIILFFNLYAYQEVVDPLKNFGESRIYYIPSIFVSIYAACLWIKIKNLHALAGRLLLFVIVGIYIGWNCSKIYKQMDIIQYKSEAMKQYISYTKTKLTKQPDIQVILAPSAFEWPKPMIKYVWKHNIEFVTFDEGWEERTKNYSINSIAVIDYDYGKSKENIDDNGRIVEKTQQYRLGKKIHPNNP